MRLDPDGLERQILLAESETSALLTRCAALGSALPTETQVENGTSQSKSGISVNLR